MLPTHQSRSLSLSRFPDSSGAIATERDGRDPARANAASRHRATEASPRATTCLGHTVGITFARGGMSMDYFEAAARRDRVKAREAEGAVADSMEVRRAIVERIHAGEITLEQGQAELTR